MSDPLADWPWVCEACGASGFVAAALTAVWGVGQAMGRAHRMASPDCKHGGALIRCLPRFGTDRARWRQMLAQMSNKEQADE